MIITKLTAISVSGMNMEVIIVSRAIMRFCFM